MKFRFVSVYTYANMCKMSRQGIYNKIQRGVIKFSPYCEGSLIDILEYPPYEKVKEFEPVSKPVNTLPSWVFEDIKSDLSKLGIKTKPPL